MNLSWLAFFLKLNRAKRARERNKILFNTPEKQRLELQLHALNKTWAEAVTNTAYYSNMRSNLKLPERFSSIEEFVNLVPISKKADLNKYNPEHFRTQKPHKILRTGGTTGEIFRFGVWRNELLNIGGVNAIIGRSWWKVKPYDRLFLIWGQAHIFGEGFSRRWNIFMRELKDSLIGYYRFPAYIMSEKNIKHGYEKLLHFRPKYIVGFSSALEILFDYLAKKEYEKQFKKLGLRVVIGAGEAFLMKNSKGKISDLLGCPVIMEYGSIESGVIAYQHSKGGYRVFWNTHLLEGIANQYGRYDAIITILSPRYVPLIRYSLEDEIEVSNSSSTHNISLSSFDDVLGRTNDYLQIGADKIFWESIGQSMPRIKEVRAYQFIQEGDSFILNVILNEGSSLNNVARRVKNVLSRIHPALGMVEIRQVSDLETTIAGKRRFVIRR